MSFKLSASQYMSYLQNFNYQISGEGSKKLVFLHGLMGFGANWRRIVNSFTSEFQILVFDQRGHGKSFQPETGYAPENYADDLLKILDELQWQKVYLVGHSMGGRNAINFTSRFSHRVEKLMVVDISPNGNHGDTDRYNQLLARVPTPFANKKLAKEFLLNEFEDPVLGGYFYANLRENESGEADWRFSKKGILESVSAVRSQNRWPEWEKIDVPILLVRGGRSKDLPEELFEEMLQRNPNARGVTIEDAGHWVHSDKPNEFIEVLRNYL